MWAFKHTQLSCLTSPIDFPTTIYIDWSPYDIYIVAHNTPDVIGPTFVQSWQRPKNYNQVTYVDENVEIR